MPYTETFYFSKSHHVNLNYRLTPFSIVSSTSVDASCTNVRALALENPEIAEDSESEDRRDWSNEEGTTNRGPSIRFWFCFDGIYFWYWNYVREYWFYAWFGICNVLHNNNVINSGIRERNVWKRIFGYKKNGKKEKEKRKKRRKTIHRYNLLTNDEFFFLFKLRDKIAVRKENLSQQ